MGLKDNQLILVSATLDYEHLDWVWLIRNGAEILDFIQLTIFALSEMLSELMWRAMHTPKKGKRNPRPRPRDFGSGTMSPRISSAKYAPL